MALTFATIKSEIGSQIRLDSSQPANDTLLTRWANEAIQKLHSKFDWPWYIDREIVQTVADKTSGTVSVSAGGTTVTGSSTAFASVDVGKYIQFSTSDEWYKITAVGSATSLTIEAAYVETSALSGGTYTIRQLFYKASTTADKILSARQFQSPRKLTAVHYLSFDQFHPNPESTSKGEIYLPWAIDSGGQINFTVYPSADEIYNIELRVKLKATENDVSRIPEKWRHTILTGGLVPAYAYVAKDSTDVRTIRQDAKFEKEVVDMISECSPNGDTMDIIQNRESRIGIGHLIRLPEEYDTR